MSFYFGTLTPRLVHPTAPVLLTKNGPLGTPIQCLTSLEQDRLLTHLKFENNIRSKSEKKKKKKKKKKKGGGGGGLDRCNEKCSFWSI